MALQPLCFLRSANFSWKGTESKYFRPGRSHAVSVTFFFLNNSFKNIKPFLAHRLLRESHGWLVPAMLPYGEVEEKRKVQGDVDMGFSPPTKSRWKLRVEKENWGPGICLSLKNKNKTSHLFTCNAHFIVQDRKAEGSGESWSRSYH